MILIDTNILLYAANRDDARSIQAARALESVVNRGSGWALSWSIVYEFLRVSTHAKVFPSPLDAQSAWNFVAELIRRPDCHLLTETTLHQELVDQCLKEVPRIRGNFLHDFHLAVLMREHGITRILTEDRDFRMFPWIELVSLTDA